MSKLVLSGDLTYFRPDMLVKIVETLRLDGILFLESEEDKGMLSLMQGKVVGAVTTSSQGISAMLSIVRWNQGTFGFRLLAGQTTVSFRRQEELMAFQDNAALFKHVYAQNAVRNQPQAASGPLQATPAAVQPAATVPAEAAVASGTAPVAAPPAAQRVIPPAGAGPLARIPELTDKGRVTLRTLQTNYAMRGVQVEDDVWRVLGKVDGRASVYQIGEAVNLRGERLNSALEELINKGLLKFAQRDPALDSARGVGTKMRFGEYMVASGLISQEQLDTALTRQQELAKRGRYMWLGEILVELNYTRPSKVQEVLALLKRQ